MAMPDGTLKVGNNLKLNGQPLGVLEAHVNHESDEVRRVVFNGICQSPVIDLKKMISFQL